MTVGRNSSDHRRTRGCSWVLLFSCAFLFTILTSCGKDKVIIREIIRDPVQPPDPVELSFPPPDTFITVNNPTFYWHYQDEVIRYQLQVSRSGDFVYKTIDVNTGDSSYMTVSEIGNGSYFWRVRARSLDSLWGDWSDAEIRAFYKSDYVSYFDMISSVHTVGIAQDVFVRGDSAYVADGQSDLTFVDISSKSSPNVVRNIDTITDDFAKGIYVAPADTFPFVFVADMDAHVQVINPADTLLPLYSTFGEQNIEDLDGTYISDTLYIVTVRSKGVSPANFSYYKVTYQPFPVSVLVSSTDLRADGNGVFVGDQYSYVAGGVAGLVIVDHSDINNPAVISELDLEGSALSVYAVADYVYVAADRAGVFVVDVSDKYNPLVTAQVNTSGRTKDIHVAGYYAYIADGSGGLKVIDISIPDSSHFVAARSTPYAYGLWADNDYIYLCDRDEGLMIFEIQTSR
jgi:hypothetical protein